MKSVLPYEMPLFEVVVLADDDVVRTSDTWEYNPETGEYEHWTGYYSLGE